MKDMGIVRGSKESAIPLYIGKDTIYVRTDIRQVPPGELPEGSGEVWEYHEVQHPKGVQQDPLPSWPRDATQTDIARILLNFQIEQIDKHSERPGRAIKAAELQGQTPDPEDVARLLQLETQAQALRAELNALGVPGAGATPEAETS